MFTSLTFILEHSNNTIKKSSLDACVVAKQIAVQSNLTFNAVLIGNTGIDIIPLNKMGIDRLFHLVPKDYVEQTPFGARDCIIKLIADKRLNLIASAHTAFNSELAGYLSIANEADIITNCFDVHIDENSVSASRHVFAGRFKETLQTSKSNVILTLRATKSEIPHYENKMQYEQHIIESSAEKCKIIETKHFDKIVDIADANILIVGGKGMQSAANFNLLEELASLLNASVGASRDVVDTRWRPQYEQVGQTGKTVSPAIYVACGVSGAVQHIAGMRNSRIIIAINKDETAPIFRVAHYGIIGDAIEVLPRLIKELRNNL